MLYLAGRVKRIILVPHRENREEKRLNSYSVSEHANEHHITERESSGPVKSPQTLTSLDIPHTTGEARLKQAPRSGDDDIFTLPRCQPGQDPP